MKIGKDKLLVMALVVLISGVGLNAVAATSLYSRVIQSQGFMSYGNQVQVVGIQLVGPGQIDANIAPTASTIPGHVYSAQLFIDATLVQVQNISWTAAQVTALQSQLVDFTGLSLGSVLIFDVEVQ